MFFDPDKFDFLQEFKTEFAAISSELQKIIDLPMKELDRNTWAGERPNYLKSSHDKGPSWKTYTFKFFGIDHLPNLKSCPTIETLLTKHSNIVSAEFSMLEPETHILPHTGFTSKVYRSHLGVSIPEGDIGIKVGQKTVKWKKGQFIVFDDGVTHEAWNRTKEQRVVLMIDFVPKNSNQSPLEICKEILSSTNDKHIMDIAPKESWLEWLKTGQFPTR